jgi:cytidine deaminase
MSLRAVALTVDDEALVTAARQVIGDNYEHGRHHIGAAVRMRGGRVFVGVHVEAYVGRIALCAEAVALGAALSAGARGVETVVAVAHPPAHESRAEAWVVTPCGMCRELISDFGPNAWIIIPSAEGPPAKVAVLDLLPAKYTRPDACLARLGEDGR